MKIILICLSFASTDSLKGKGLWKCDKEQTNWRESSPFTPQDSGSQTLVFIREFCEELVAMQGPGPGGMHLSLAELL